jgi:hypothetical protein
MGNIVCRRNIYPKMKLCEDIKLGATTNEFGYFGWRAFKLDESCNLEYRRSNLKKGTRGLLIDNNTMLVSISDKKFEVDIGNTEWTQSN